MDQLTLTGESNPVRKTNDAVLKDDLTRAETHNLILHAQMFKKVMEKLLSGKLE